MAKAKKKVRRGKSVVNLSPDFGAEEVSSKAMVRLPVAHVINFQYSPKTNQGKGKGNNAILLMALLVPDPKFDDYIVVKVPERGARIYVAHALQDGEKLLRLVAVESTQQDLLKI